MALSKPIIIVLTKYNYKSSFDFTQIINTLSVNYNKVYFLNFTDKEIFLKKSLYDIEIQLHNYTDILQSKIVNLNKYFFYS